MTRLVFILAWGALLGTVACSSAPPHVILTVRDPDGLAGDAVTLGFGEDLDTLEPVDLNGEGLPFDFLIWFDEPVTAALWVDAHSADGQVLGRGRLEASLATDGVRTARVDLGYPCDRVRGVNERCALETDNSGAGYLGVCSGIGACRPSACGDGLVDDGLGEECDDANTDTSDSCPDGGGGACLLAVCGDGHIWNTDGGGEECEDLNTEINDGCAFCVEELFGPPAVLNDSATTDNHQDTDPKVYTDGAGVWLAIWTTANPISGSGIDNDIMISRSSDHGATWTPRAALNTNAVTDTLSDTRPHLATDRAGNWVAAWYSSETLGGTVGGDFDILFARSSDNGVTWTAPQALNTNADSDDARDQNPFVATDGAGRWIAVWNSVNTLGDTIGSDDDFLFAVSSDLGATWTPPAPLNSTAGTDVGDDFGAQLAGDGLGHWVAAWYSNDTLNGTIGSDQDIIVARSDDGGVTWTPPAALADHAETDVDSDKTPQLVYDGTGDWLVGWRSSVVPGYPENDDFDVLLSRSSDFGATWSSPIALNANAASDGADDESLRLATDGNGRWMAVWYCDNTLGDTIGGDDDLLVARSADNGHHWTVPIPLNLNAGTDTRADARGGVAADAAGHWVTVWESEEDLGGTIGTDTDVLFAIANY